MTPDELSLETAKTIPALLRDKVQATCSPPNYDELQAFDVIVLSLGVPLQHRFATQGRAFHIPVTTAVSFAAALRPKTVDMVCITG
jgi:UDP-N-acetylmuramoylalanine-D-glutamate ligase